MKEDKPKFREHTDKLWSMDAEKDKTPSTVHNPNRLFEALLATLPHLQSLEEPLTRSSVRQKKIFVSGSTIYLFGVNSKSDFILVIHVFLA